jgi:hypothetical protein
MSKMVSNGPRCQGDWLLSPPATRERRAKRASIRACSAETIVDLSSFYSHFKLNHS